MKTPTIDNYLEAFLNPAGRFKTLQHVDVLRDAWGEPLLAVRPGSADFAILRAGKPAVASCPLGSQNPFELRDPVKNRYGGSPSLLLGEVLVFDDSDQSTWYDLWLVEGIDADLFQKNAPREREPDEGTPDLFFSEGLAVAEQEGLYGFVDREGHTVIPCRYSWAEPFDEGLALVRQGEFFGLIDKSGREVLPPVYEDIRWRSANGVVLVCGENGLWRLHDRQGEIISQNTFDFIVDFSCDLASVRREAKYGYIDRTGEIVIPLLYDEAYTFSDEGLATVVKNGATFMIDTEGMVFD